MNQKKSTIFCDIDGTIFKYRKFETYKTSIPMPVPNVVDMLAKLYNNGHCIVLTTARPENLRSHTICELNIYNIQYHQLVMGIERGTRYLINDKEDININRAIGINVARDNGFSKKDMEILSNIIHN
uniref:FCP1 homology domain-containing protein n=1 Tax=viral metagenome TaxID=1070528 RepID=A0A6C0CK66_9ZZZZ